MPNTPIGWPVLDTDSRLLHSWKIPGWKGSMPIRGGSVGFILAHFMLFYHEEVERLDEGHPHDDWGYARRQVTGGSSWSEHAAGSAMDLNATQHPYGVSAYRTFTDRQMSNIRKRIASLQKNNGGTPVLRWGATYNTPDGMHFEVMCNGRMEVAERVARRLIDTPRGDKILDLNPGQKKIILS